MNATGTSGRQYLRSLRDATVLVLLAAALVGVYAYDPPLIEEPEHRQLASLGSPTVVAAQPAGIIEQDSPTADFAVGASAPSVPPRPAMPPANPPSALSALLASEMPSLADKKPEVPPLPASQARNVSLSLADKARTAAPPLVDAQRVPTPLPTRRKPDPSETVVITDVYRTGQIDQRVHGVPAAIEQGVFADPERYLEPLVQALTVNVQDEFLKVKILHDWLAENIAYDVDSYLNNRRVDTAWTATLRSRKSICQGYSELLVKMCQAARIPCVTVPGYARGYSYSASQPEDLSRSNHAWNAVFVGGAWQLVDVTWDAGHPDHGSYRKRYSTAYLFPEPRSFLYSHFPTEARWQLVDEPYAPAQFAALPFLVGDFFEQGLRLGTRLSRVTRVGESTELILDVPVDRLLVASLKDAANRNTPQRTLIQRDGRQCKVLVAFPQAGPWGVSLFSKRREEPGEYAFAATFDFESSAGTSTLFPVTYFGQDNLDGRLDSPLSVPLQTNQPLVFQLHLSGAKNVHLVVGDKTWQKLWADPAERGLYRLTAQVPRGQSVMLVAEPARSDRKYATLVEFKDGTE